MLFVRRPRLHRALFLGPVSDIMMIATWCPFEAGPHGLLQNPEEAQRHIGSSSVISPSVLLCALESSHVDSGLES